MALVVLLLVSSGTLLAAHSRVPDVGQGPYGAVSVAVPPTLAPAGAPTLSPTNVTLTVNRSSVNLSSDFWGTTVNNEVRMFRGESNAVNATPARVLVWPGAMAGEDYNPLTNTHYGTYNGTPIRALTSESQFVAMCKATHCTAIVQLPAEIYDTKIAEAIVNYTEGNLSFIPAYWMIGNEPELWSHWKIPWSNWPTQYSTGPTPAQFGSEVLAYVKVIRAVDNTTPILGLPASGCTCGSWTFEQWISGVLNVTGTKIQAVAFHEYPAGWLGTGDGSLHDFYGTIQGPAGIPPRMAGARAAVHSACGKCNVSVFISELGSALSWSVYGQYAIGFSGALSLASQVTQAMDVNLTNVDLFATELATTNSWFGPTGIPRVDYTLYTNVFDHLGTEAYGVNVSGMDRTIYGIDTVAPTDGGRQDLLVVNDNITHAITFVPQFGGPTGSYPVEAWSWNGSIHSTSYNSTTWVEPYTANPVPREFESGLPGSYTLPPQSLVLFEAYPARATVVEVSQNGVPSPTAWYVSVGSRFYTSTGTNFSLLLPAGSYPVASVGVPLPIGGKERNASEQLGPSVASMLQVGGAFSNLTVDFVPQWRLNASASPAVGGSVTPTVDWWNANRSLNLTATPNVGYAFVGWSGWGNGSVNGSGRTVTIVPNGRITEKARFVVGDQVILLESGLPAGTPWTVSVRGFSWTSNTTGITVYEPPGTDGFSVTPIPGYRAIPLNGVFTVTGGYVVVPVRFDPITPPSPTYPVTFRVPGLPSNTTVSITVRNVTETAGAASPVFELINGSYAYDVGYVAGYHADAPLKTFHVLGGPLVVVVPFVPTMYSVIWQANGTRAGMNWSVALDGERMNATSAWVTTSLPNGTYTYTVQLPANYTVTPRTGVVWVNGAGTALPLVFNLTLFRAWFEAKGPGAFTPWSVRLGTSTRSAAANQSAFLTANGTYTFDVHPPPGYFAIPSHGSLTVAGAPPPVEIRFDLISDRPSAALVAALSVGALWTSVWIGASIFVGFTALRAWRRRAR